MKNFIAIPLILFAATTAEAALVARTVEYKHGDTILEGYLAYDGAQTEKKPGILVVHEWKGLNDYAKSRAEQLAGLGYVALAVDMYGKGVRVANHEEAAKLSGVYRQDRQLMRDRAKAAYDFLKSQEQVDSGQIAAIGYCFGGTTVLEMARAGFDLKGVASFHGGLSTSVPAKPGEVKARIIAFHGADDKFISPEEVKNFQDEMRSAQTDWEFIIFSDAVHSFTVPDAGSDKSTGMAYNEKADLRSWAVLLDFLQDVFR